MYKKFLDDFENILNHTKNQNDLMHLKVQYIGKNGIINKQLILIKDTDIKDKKLHFDNLNKIKKIITAKLHERTSILSKIDHSSGIDITLPGFGYTIGSEHIINKALKDISLFFTHLNFDIKNGYEIDTPYYNFDALNINKKHPSRSLADSFYISNDLMLRTHTSNMQIHIMEEKKPPLRCISYGKVYRKDSDATHTPMFHQVEGFLIDNNVSIGNLKLLLVNFLKYFFQNNKIKINIRTSYFPFTEPSIEMDIECVSCFGKKCTLCKYSGWIEVLGCGMIHPKVLKNCNIDKNFTGFAFGMGVERLTMIKHDINDIRLYFENNMDFLKQF